MKKRVLIAEDEDLITSTIVALLNTMGLEYIAVDNGEDAIKEFKSKKFDLIITDIFMPKLDGFQFIEFIRNVNKKIPIIVISGYIDNETIRKIKNIGADEYIEKPFSIKEVKEVIKNFIGESWWNFVFFSIFF